MATRHQPCKGDWRHRLNGTRRNPLVVHARSDSPKYVIGRAAAETGEQLDRGDTALRRCLRHTPKPNEPSLAATHWRLGMIAEKRGDTAAAKQEYQAAAALDPKLRPLKEALARLK